ncbi:hypothetical protein MASR2M79_19580 [Aminivibrio sp.]
MDGRDMAFKRALGLPPFGDAAAALFPSGKYEIAVAGKEDRGRGR